MIKKTFLTKTNTKTISTEQNECPVCHKFFDLTEDSKYLIKNKYVCSWKCFRKYAHEHSSK